MEVDLALHIGQFSLKGNIDQMHKEDKNYSSLIL
jgi:hypothetical protein